MGVPGQYWALVPALLVAGMLVAALVLAEGAAFGSNFRRPRPRALERACFANQIAVTEALAFYNRDKKTDLRSFDEATLRFLLDGGYLQGWPSCPALPRTRAPYRTGAAGCIECVEHGTLPRLLPGPGVTGVSP